MKKNDWLFGFGISILVVLVEFGYLAHHVGINDAVFRWVEQLTVSKASDATVLH